MANSSPCRFSLVRQIKNSTALADWRRVRFFKKKCFQKKDWRRRAAAGRNETRNHAVRRCSNKTSRRMNPQHLLLLRPPVLPAAPRHGLPARRQPVAPARRRKPSGGLASIPQSKPELRACDLAHGRALRALTDRALASRLTANGKTETAGPAAGLTASRAVRLG